MDKKEKKQIVYKLSALYTTNENIEIALKSRFQRITFDYILVYDEDVPDCAQEITATDMNDLLTTEDRDWLYRCNMTILSEIAKEHEDAQTKSFLEFFKELDANIKDELGKDKEADGKQ